MKRLLATLVIATSLTGCGYNDFQRLDEDTKSKWSEVLNQYQRRADLVPPQIVDISLSLIDADPALAATPIGMANDIESLTAAIEAYVKKGGVA